MFDNPPPLFRPPAEGGSLILRIAEGCPYNGCTFCGMYKGVRYRVLAWDEVDRQMAEARGEWPDANRIFLADGDVMALPFGELESLLLKLRQAFPAAARVSSYANGDSILALSDEQLKRLKELRLHTLYMGLESGEDDVLRRVKKRETSGRMVEAGRKAQAAGLRMSVMILVGVGGRALSARHAMATAAALNRMQPRLLSALRVIPVPGTAMGDAMKRGQFDMLTEQEAVQEIRSLVAGLALEGTVFRANHTSNIVPLEARFPKDKERLLAELDELLESGELDANGPGRMPMML